MLVAKQIELGIHGLPSDIGILDENLLAGNPTKERASHYLGSLMEKKKRQG
jgi:hypothetical protein